MEDKPASIELFYSYAQADEKWAAKLQTHLAQLEQQHQISSWHRQKILAGRDRMQEISAHLDTAHIILLLVSPDFLASDYCYGIEMQRAIERHKTNSARVIPIILRTTDWTTTPFSGLKALPDNGKSITEWSNKDKAFLNVVQGIRRTIEELHAFPEHQLESQATGQHQAQPTISSTEQQLAKGQERPATVFLSYTPEDREVLKNLQLQLNVRGVRTQPDTADPLLRSLTKHGIEQFIKHEADALALFLTPASLARQSLWEIDVPAALDRCEHDPGFSALLVLSGLSHADLQQFCSNRNLPDLAHYDGVQQIEVPPHKAGAVEQQELSQIAQILLKAALTQRLRRVGADRTYEPRLCLRTWKYEPPTSSLDLDLDWVELIPGKDRLPTPEEWEQILLPALRDVKQVLSEKVSSRRLHIFIQSLLPVAIALGFTFPKSSHFTLFITDRYGSWSSEEKSAETAPLHSVSLTHTNGDPNIAVIELAISRSTERGVTDALTTFSLTPGHHIRLEPPEDPSDTSIKDSSHALAIARQLGQFCRQLYDQDGVQHIHLFAALTASLAVLVGHQLSALCPITVYEFSEGTYKPLGTLANSTSK